MLPTDNEYSPKPSTSALSANLSPDTYTLVTSLSTIRSYDVVYNENDGVNEYPSTYRSLSLLLGLQSPVGIAHTSSGILSYTGIINLNDVLLSVVSLYALLLVFASDLGAKTLVIY